MTLRDGKVYELMIDYDGTTRSRYSSFGLYGTSAAAERAATAIFKSRGAPLGDYRVDTRTVR